MRVTRVLPQGAQLPLAFLTLGVNFIIVSEKGRGERSEVLSLQRQSLKGKENRVKLLFRVDQQFLLRAECCWPLKWVAYSMRCLIWIPNSAFYLFRGFLPLGFLRFFFLFWCVSSVVIFLFEMGNFSSCPDGRHCSRRFPVAGGWIYAG